MNQFNVGTNTFKVTRHKTPNGCFVRMKLSTVGGNSKSCLLATIQPNKTLSINPIASEITIRKNGYQSQFNAQVNVLNWCIPTEVAGAIVRAIQHRVNKKCWNMAVGWENAAKRRLQGPSLKDIAKIYNILVGFGRDIRWLIEYPILAKIVYNYLDRGYTSWDLDAKTITDKMSELGPVRGILSLTNKVYDKSLVKVFLKMPKPQETITGGLLNILELATNAKMNPAQFDDLSSRCWQSLSFCRNTHLIRAVIEYFREKGGVEVVQVTKNWLHLTGTHMREVSNWVLNNNDDPRCRRFDFSKASLNGIEKRCQEWHEMIDNLKVEEKIKRQADANKPFDLPLPSGVTLENGMSISNSRHLRK